LWVRKDRTTTICSMVCWILFLGFQMPPSVLWWEVPLALRPERLAVASATNCTSVPNPYNRSGFLFRHVSLCIYFVFHDFSFLKNNFSLSEKLQEYYKWFQYTHVHISQLLTFYFICLIILSMYTGCRL
jgi:hypothetical protein